MFIIEIILNLFFRAYDLFFQELIFYGSKVSRPVKKYIITFSKTPIMCFENNSVFNLQKSKWINNFEKKIT